MLNALARAGLMTMVAALLFAGGCRSNTDRIRVLEAEKAAAERENLTKAEMLAKIKAEALEAQNRAAQEAALRNAAEARLAAQQGRRGGTDGAMVDAGAGGLDVDRMGRDLDGIDVRETADGAAITLSSDVTFRPGRADLNRDAQATLKRVASAIGRERNIETIRIEGHTDSDPIRKSGWKSNEELSRVRAQQVQRFLVANGVQEEILSISGFGAARPVASNDDKSGKAANRRVEIVLVSKGR